MIVYIISFALIYVIGFACKRSKSRNGKVKERKTRFFLIVACLILSFIEGFRAYSVGTDTYMYVSNFSMMKIQRFEIGFQWLMQAVHYFTDNPNVFLLICAILTHGIYFFVIYKMSEDCYYSVFAYISLMCYFTSFNAVRQSLACSIVMLSYYCIKQRKVKLYIALMIVAICIHSSALIGFMYVIIFLYNSKRNDGRVESGNTRDIIELVVTCLVAVAGYVLLERGMRLFAIVVPKYAHYMFSEYAEMSGGIQKPLVYTAIFICFILFTKSEDIEKRLLSFPLGIAVMFSFMHMRISYIARFMWYFDAIAIFALPYMFNNSRLKRKQAKIFKAIVSCILIAFMLYNLLLKNYMRVSDYLFYWQ